MAATRSKVGRFFHTGTNVRHILTLNFNVKQFFFITCEIVTLGSLVGFSRKNYGNGYTLIKVLIFMKKNIIYFYYYKKKFSKKPSRAEKECS